MAALDFPASPSDGDVYAGYVFNAAKGVWQWQVIDPSLVSLSDTNIVTPSAGQALVYDGSDWVNGFSGFTAQQTITASNASWPVPTLASPIVKVTAIGAGGGGAADRSTSAGGTGGTTTFNAGGAGTVTAVGGPGANRTPTGSTNSQNGLVGVAGFASYNGGLSGGVNDSAANFFGGNPGQGGQITVSYLDLTGISTVNVTIGAGGSGATNASSGGAGGRGEVIVEYVAG